MIHIPVLASETVQFFKGSGPPRFILDATFGRGGHTRLFLEKFPESKIVALDRDPDAIKYGTEELKEFIDQGRLQLNHSNYSEYKAEEKFDGIMMDLGVSSPQLDTAHRGFSFMKEGPLDMRMDPTSGLTAAEVVNSYTEKEIADILYQFGEERKSFKIAKAICNERPIETTTQLAKIVESCLGWRKGGMHPATRTFQALRIFVNEEFKHVEEGIKNLVQDLSPGGRFIVITFHSLEDKIVKRLFHKELSEFGKPVQKKVVKPSKDEQEQNPRSRSAHLRVFERGLQ